MKKQVKKTVKPVKASLQQQINLLHQAIDRYSKQMATVEEINGLRNDMDQQSARLDDYNSDAGAITIQARLIGQLEQRINKLSVHLDASDGLNHITMAQLEYRLNTEVSAINTAVCDWTNTAVEQHAKIDKLESHLENQIQALSEALLDCNDQLIDTDGNHETHWTF